MSNRKKNQPVKFGLDGNGSNSKRPKMSFKRLKLADKKTQTHKVEISWSNIQSQIAELLYRYKVIPEGQEIMSMKLDYAGGFVAQDKIIPVEVITKKGVKFIKIND